MSSSKGLVLLSHFLIIGLIFLAFSPSAFPQGARYDGVAQRNVQGFLAPIPGATIVVCSSSGTGTPCSPITPIYTDAGLTQQIPGSTFLADSNGNFGFYAPASTTYKVSITATGVTGQLITVVLPIVGGGASTFSKINTEFWVDGVTFTTPQAAMTAANTAGGGIVHVPCGTFTGPTTFYSSVSVVSTCSFLYNLVNPLTGHSSPPVTGTFFTYTANLTWASLSNMRIDGITFDFQNNGAGIAIGNQFVNNQLPNIAVVRCGSPTVDCIAWLTSGSVSTNNSGFNDFGNLYILTNQTTNQQANCMSMSGSGPVNAGAFATDNTFWNIVCTGGTRNGLIFRLNSDSNYFRRVVIGTLASVASTGCVVINDITPASDQDADGGTIDNMICQSLPATFRTGQTSGWRFGVATGGSGLPTVVNLGGTPLFGFNAIGLGTSANADVMVGGRISAVGSVSSGGGPATGTTAGDATFNTLTLNGNYTITVAPPNTGGNTVGWRTCWFTTTHCMGVASSTDYWYTGNWFGIGSTLPNNDGGSSAPDSATKIAFDALHGAQKFAEVASVPAGISNADVCYGDATLHGILCNPNNTGFVPLPKTIALTADWTCGTGGTVASCTSATIIGSGGGVPLTFTLPLVAASYTLECDGVTGQATAATANQWNLLTATNGATNVTANYTMATAATAYAAGAVTDQASTTTTFQIAPSWTLGGTGTKMPFHIWAKIEGASASGTVVSLQLLAPTVGDLVTIYRGTSCRLF